MTKPKFDLNFEEEDALPSVNTDQVGNFTAGRVDTTVPRKNKVKKEETAVYDNRNIVGRNRKTSGQKLIYPWQAEGLREDVAKPFIIRFNEVTHAKLLFIKDNIPPSAHEFCLKALESAIDAEIKKITKQQS